RRSSSRPSAPSPFSSSCESSAKTLHPAVMRKCVGRGGRSAGISGRASELRGSAEAARAQAVIARKGAEQKPRKIRADQSLEAVGDRQALLAFQRRTV